MKKKEWGYVYVWGFPGGSAVTTPPANAGDLGLMPGSRPGFDAWVRKIPWRKKWQPTPVFLPGQSHGLRSKVGYGVTKSQTRLSD